MREKGLTDSPSLPLTTTPPPAVRAHSFPDAMLSVMSVNISLQLLMIMIGIDDVCVVMIEIEIIYYWYFISSIATMNTPPRGPSPAHRY